MVKALILYYLNIKSTHGYEIQKFIQTTGLDVWAKIKSGSIYYALSKLEKSGDIALVREETTGSRVRRIYEITEQGRHELQQTLQQELEGDLSLITSAKFILPVLLNRIDKETAIPAIEAHLNGLRDMLRNWRYWERIKLSESSSQLERITFEMTISNIEYSMRWHEALLEEYDLHVNRSEKQEMMIQHVDFGEVEQSADNPTGLDMNRIDELKDMIMNHPEASKEALDELIQLMMNAKTNQV